MAMTPDMPTDWANGKKITPNGESEGNVRYGYNYLMEKINEIITFANNLEVDILGKIKFETVEELPEISEADPYTIYRYPDPESTPEEPFYLCAYAMNGKWYNLGGGGRVDTEIKRDSTNPVQNQAIYNALKQKLNASQYVVDSELNKESFNPVQNSIIATNIERLNKRPYGINLKGSVPTLEDLPLEPAKNDAYWVVSEQLVYAWNGEEWIEMGGISDLGNYYTKTEVDALPAIQSGITQEKVSQYDTINQAIPSDASSVNKLTSKDYVDKQIQENAAFFCGRWATYASIPVNAEDFETEGFNAPGFNNYLVVEADETAPEPHTGASFRYLYDSTIDETHPYDKTNWKRQYFVNERPMTSEEVEAIQSGITSAKVTTYDGYATGKQNTLTAEQINAVNSGITEIPNSIPTTPTAGQVVSMALLKSKTEEWTFTLDDDTEVTKKVVVFE